MKFKFISAVLLVSVAFIVGMIGLNLNQTLQKLEEITQKKAETTIFITNQQKTKVNNFQQQENMISTEQKRLDFSGIPTNLVKKIAKLSQVKRYNMSTSTNVSALNFQPASAKDELVDLDSQQEVTITGVIATSQVSQFITHNYKIVAGKGLSAQNVKTNQILIEKNLAEKNNLKVGDVLKIKVGQTQYPLKIHGIYQAKEGFYGFEISLNGTKREPANTIYAPYELLKKIEPQKKTVDSATFELKKASAKQEFLKQAQKIIGNKKYLLKSDDTLYQTLLRKLQSWRRVSQKLIIFALCVVVLVLVIKASKEILVGNFISSLRLFFKKNWIILLSGIICAGVVDFLYGEQLGELILNLIGMASTFLADQKLIFIDVQKLPLDISQIMLRSDLTQFENLLFLTTISLIATMIVVVCGRVLFRFYRKK